MPHAPKPNAYDRALAMLARREYSQRELRTRLVHAGCGQEESESALRRLREENAQDDRRFGEMIVHARVGRGYGPARIRAELRAHALPDAAIDALIDAAGIDWEELARAQLRKKYGRKVAADRATQAKRLAFLQRRGFVAATARIVTREMGHGP